MCRVIAGDRCWCGKEERDRKTSPDRANECEGELADRERRTGGGDADDERADRTGSGAVGPHARSHAYEERKRVDSEREQQPAKEPDAGDANEDAEDDRGGGLREKRSNGCASTTTTAQSEL